MKKLIICGLAALPFSFSAQSKFAQLDQELPTPNEYRTAAGAPGHNYYQQKADYKMSIRIDDETQKLTGEETITYTNNSPDKLEYLWLQLDQNLYAQNSDSKLIEVEKYIGCPLNEVLLEFLTVMDLMHRSLQNLVYASFEKSRVRSQERE